MPENNQPASDTFSVTIEALTTEGQGIARVPGTDGTRGYTVFCEGLLPGEEAEVRVTSRKKNFAEAECVRLLTPSPDRTAPWCSAFENCGGCTFQHYAYPEQLRLKREHVVSCLTRIGKQPAEKIESLTRPAIGMESPFDYRNHMQYPVGETIPAPKSSPDSETAASDAVSTEISTATAALIEPASPETSAPPAPAAPAPAASRDFQIGLYGRKSHTIVHHNSCRIAHPACETVRKITERFCIEHGITGYDENTGLGYLRHLIVRAGYHTGEIMVVLVVNAEPEQSLTFPIRAYVNDVARRLEKDRRTIARKGQGEAVHPAYSSAVTQDAGWELKSVYVNCNTSGSRQGQIVSYSPEHLRLLWGEKNITDRIGDNTYTISPLSFYQVNPQQTEKLYDSVREFAVGEETTDRTKIPVLYDVFCGAGTIGLHLSDYAGKIYGIESNESAVRDACQNATLNGVKHALYRTTLAEKLKPADFPEKPSCIILDPPRKGCEPALLKTVLSLRPPKIVYVSCDPATLARDIAILAEKDYEIQAVQPVDMFPWTGHVETVVLMSKVKE